MHAEHMLAALRITLDRAPPPSDPVVWQLEFADDRAYTLRTSDRGWNLVHGADRDVAPDVVVTTDTGAWTRFLMTPPEQRPGDPPGVELRGSADDVDRFLDLVARFPYSLSTDSPDLA